MNRNRLATIWDRFGTLCILVIIVVLFSALSPTIFTKPDNIVQIFVQSAITILVAVGEFFAILIAGIDLSVGSILALTGMITGKLMVSGVHPFFAVLIGGIFVGVVLGAINGLLVNFTGLHPFIITVVCNRKNAPWT
jgi:D-allose transport system permease protein